MKRFLTDPTRLSRFVTKDDLRVIQKNIPIQKHWETKMHYGKEIISYWLKEQRNKADIRHARCIGGGVGGVVEIKYEQVSKVTNQSDDGWKKLIRPKGKLTKTGQLLLQKATEAYAYSVFGAQARTHWTIVEAGTRS